MRKKEKYRSLQVPSCPCGGHVIIRSYKAIKRDFYIRKFRGMLEYSVYCQNCSDIAWGYTKKAAIEAFNRLHEVKIIS